MAPHHVQHVVRHVRSGYIIVIISMPLVRSAPGVCCISMRLNIVVGVTLSVGACAVPGTTTPLAHTCNRQREMENRAGVGLNDYVLAHLLESAD